MQTTVVRWSMPERAFAWIAGVVVVLAAMFWQTSAAMVATWHASGTYSHGFLIVPAFLWLVWVRRQALAALPVRPSWWALPLLAAAGVLWLAAQWTSLALPAQFALVAMVPATTAAILGVAWVRALLFPFAFLFFAVPFGESWVPVLMDWTADFTVMALRLSGVPVYRDGLHFDIPSGKWSVVDSCSGIRYLFACLSVSSLYAWSIYRGTARRLLFLGCALAIAIVANWVRAYAIVMLGHLSNNQIATGADHLVYGAVFFAVIMALVFALGAVWREHDQPQLESISPTARTPGAGDRAGVDTWRRVAALVATIATVLVWPVVSTGFAAQPDLPAAVAVDLPARAGWTGSAQPVSSWQPRLSNPTALLSQSFEKGGQRVGVHLGIFGRPTAESKLTSAMNRFVEPDGLDAHWKLTRQGTARASWDGEPLDLRMGVLVGREERLVAWQWYWVDGTASASALHAAWLQLIARARGREGLSAWVTVYTRDGEDPLVAQRVLGEFVADMSGSIDSTMRQLSLVGMQASAGSN